MTCVAGIMMDGQVVMAADRAAVSGTTNMARKGAKIFRKGDFLIGFTSSFRMGDVLEHVLTIPRANEPGMDFNMKYMVLEFVPAVKAVFKDAGYNRCENDVDSAGTFPVGVRGQLYEIDEDYQVGQSLSGYHALGSGRDYALGAMHALTNHVRCSQTRVGATRIVTAGVEAAIEHCTTVSGPVDMLQLPSLYDTVHKA